MESVQAIKNKWPSKPKCSHGILKKHCLNPICGGGTAKCKHGRVKGYCKDPQCQSNQYLCKSHGIDKRYCRDKMCNGGSRSCVHKVDKAFCSNVECGGGSRLCKHSKDKRYCFMCAGKNICVKCKLNGVRTIGAECKTCTPSTNTRGRYKEERICAKLETWAEEGHISRYTTWGKRILHAETVQCGRVFPDFTFEFDDKVIILEVDEHQHSRGNYNRRCEMIRLQNIVNSYGALPVHFIRYNPDFFKVSGKNTKVSSETRQQILLRSLQRAMSNQSYNDHITLEHICYDCITCCHSDCPLYHIQSFKTMIEFAKFIDSSLPLGV